MQLPAPTERLAGCLWLPRLIAKARLLERGELPPEYAARFGHPTGVDGQFFAFFGLEAAAVRAVSTRTDAQVAAWFRALPRGTAADIEQWNQLALNLGRPGFPMGDRLALGKATVYAHLDPTGIDTIFGLLEADERKL
jgi:hypothetical protein